jgi:hypothetical protein
MRALVHVRHTPEARLLLQHPENDRAPVWNRKLDYDVIFRGQKVGRVWRFDYQRDRREGWPWHWDITCDDRKNEWGDAFTLVEAMEQFRATWDRLAPNQRSA